MLAIVRPDAWDFPLFLHVLGAIVLFGGVGTVALLAFVALRNDAQAAMLRRTAFMTTLLVVWPSFVVMRIGGQWILSREALDKDPPGWVGVGFAVSDAGILVLALITLLSWLAPRRPRAGSVLAGLTLAYVIALGVAWFAMSAKPGA
jgi:hypothetical protein